MENALSSDYLQIAMDKVEELKDAMEKILH
jgi:hypothetical protein